MRLKNKILRGVGVVAAFFCALCFGAESIASSGDYKSMVDSVLGGSGAGGASGEAYAFTSDYGSIAEMLTERVRIAEQFGEEGCVLLKNDGALPLRASADDVSEKKVTVLGNRPYTYTPAGKLRDERLTFYGGITGSRIYEQTITTREGIVTSPITLKTALAGQNVVINPAPESFYADKPYSPMPKGSEAADDAGGAYSVDEPAVTPGDTGEYGNYSDAAIVVIGRTSGEGRDYLPGSSGVKSGSSQTSALGLSNEERQLIAVADEISHGNVVVLINSAVAMEIDELKNDARVNSLMWIGLPGAYGLNGVARVLVGKASPSGHLPDTYATAASNAPAARNFGDGDPDGNAKFSWSNGNYTLPSNGHYVVMAEGIYTGYRYYETRYADCVLGRGDSSSPVGAADGAEAWRYEDEVAYAFGYGLSYTTFAQKIVSDSFVFNETENTVSLDVEVENTGAFPAKSVVQLYVQTPYTDYDRKNGVEKSAVQLVAFAKTDVLSPEDSPVTVTLTADLKYFASYDEKLAHDGVTGGYILENGNYYFAIGNGAHEALNNILRKEPNVVGNALYYEENSKINADGVYAWDISQESGFRFDSSGVDGSYFAQSESGTTVRNQMADADYNYFDTGTKITYLSRSDWDGTFPESYTGLATVDAMNTYLERNAGVYNFGTSGETPDYVQFGVDHTEEYDENTGAPLENTDIASYKGMAYEAETWDYLLSQISFEEAWKFAPLGGSNCEPFASVNAPEVWQIDGPNGNVTRAYGFAPTTGTLAVSKTDPNAGYMSADMPCEPSIAAAFNRDLLEAQGIIYGEDNLWSRNPIMWAPGMNLHRTQFNSRNHEYYSEDPLLTNKLGVAFVLGGLQKGTIMSAKHFAFNTQESYREGLSQFFREQSGRETELRAFQGLCEDLDYVNSSGNRLNALGLMTTFSRVGVCGANGHTGMMKNILRGEWGYKGLISTDMVSRTGFFNPQDCVVNNVTFMATSSGESFLQSSDWANYNNKQLVKNDPAMLTALYENMHYYMYAIANSGALNGYAPGDTIASSMSWWQFLLIGFGAGTGVAALALLSCALFCELRQGKKNRAMGGKPERI